MDFVETLKARREFTGLRVSPLLIYAKAICLALARNPELNSSWDEERQEIVYYGNVNLGIAAATPRGLMVPNIKAAQDLSLLQLCQAVNQLVQVSREEAAAGRLLERHVHHHQRGRLRGGRGHAHHQRRRGRPSSAWAPSRRRPWVVGVGDRRVVPRWVTTLAVAFDNRVVDGEQGSRFLHDVASILKEPALALLF